MTRSQVEKNTELAKFVTQNQIDPPEPKRRITVKEEVTEDNFENISKKEKKIAVFVSDNIFLDKTLTFEQFETDRTSSLSYLNDSFNSSLKTNSSIICGSIDQDGRNKILILLCKINSLVIITNNEKIIAIILQEIIIGMTIF